jgi:hypothetical protein
VLSDARFLVIHIACNEKASKSNKLADAEIHFTAGPLQGLRLCGFTIYGKWEQKKLTATNVTFPKRTYQTRQKETRDYMLLRPQPGVPAERVNEIATMILAAYEAQKTV